MDPKELIADASKYVNDMKLAGDNTAGGVAATIVSGKGNVYHGVCIDTGSGMGFCAEHAAVGAMITAGESQIRQVVAVWKDDNGRLYVLPPCGRCREFMRQINDANLDTDVVLSKDKTAKLSELLPFHEWPQPEVG